ncbi:MAG: hypothetical protein ACLP29_14215, partial [Dissulfurispiraceae bacterium]
MKKLLSGAIFLALVIAVPMPLMAAVDINVNIPLPPPTIPEEEVYINFRIDINIVCIRHHYHIWWCGKYYRWWQGNINVDIYRCHYWHRNDT